MAAKSKKCEHVRAHFSLGNDEVNKVSSYQADFSLSNLQLYRPRVKPAPPISAEILPYVDPASEKHKWVSSTMRDFSSFGNEARTRAYQTSRGGFIETKQVQTKNVGLMRDNPMSMTSSYAKDFQTPGICTPGIPEYMSITKAALKKLVDKREKNISEARHAFQWPSQDRIKVPRHVQKHRL